MVKLELCELDGAVHVNRIFAPWQALLVPTVSGQAMGKAALDLLFGAICVGDRYSAPYNLYHGYWNEK